MHGIIELVAIEISPDVARSISHTPARFQAHMRDEAIKKANPSLGQIVRTFKGAATYEIRRADRPDFAWQGDIMKACCAMKRLLIMLVIIL